MDFDKPYEPAPSAAGAAPRPDETPGRKRAPQAVPVLFRKKAA